MAVVVSGLAAAGAAVALAGRSVSDSGRQKDGRKSGDIRVVAESIAMRVQRGFDLAPVPLDTVRRNPAPAGLGSHLVNAAGGCNGCHTCPPYLPGHDPHQGGDGQINNANYLAGGTPFRPGPFSANLAPDRDGLPGGTTWVLFRDAIRLGHDPHNPGQILQVMPWPVCRGLVDDDLKAIFACLSSIPAAAPGCGAEPTAATTR